MSSTKNKLSGQTKPIWFFKEGALGDFEALNPQYTSKLYFPLMNEKGMKTYITPELKGDICTDFQHYLTVPNVTEDLHRQAPGRNFWLHVQGQNPWSVSGMSVFQKSDLWNKPEKSIVRGRPGVFELLRDHPDGLVAKTTVFVPTADNVEIMLVCIRNSSKKVIRFKAYNATPIFARSADNVRDHRQVTSMFQETFVDEFGVRVKPRMVHDENGHVKNETNYLVYGFDENGQAPKAIWPKMLDFIGEGGSLENPEAISKSLDAKQYNNLDASGVEAISAFRFDETILVSGKETYFIVLSGITDNPQEIDRWTNKYADLNTVFEELKKTETYWKELTEKITLQSKNTQFGHLFKWVVYQVKCRQVFGNSFLPDYGYGRGGRGWRDLWQDLLAVFLIDPDSARQEIVNNFLGIRFDGSNATIIGERSGEFKADRNNIPRTWSDHGAWPVFVTAFYLNQTGDYQMLLEQKPYWKDKHVFRSKKQDELWGPEQGSKQLSVDDQVVYGSIFEHLLLQQLSSFYHVGEHNITLLEGADWNDTYDMADKAGETVCFHHFYAGNFKKLVEWLNQIKLELKRNEIELAEEILLLLDRIPARSVIDYSSPQAKQDLLQQFFELTSHKLSGRKTKLNIEDLITDLTEKSNHMTEWVQEKEWLNPDNSTAFFNGHYDDFGQAFDGEFGAQTRIDLTSQVIPIMMDTATEKQIPKMFEAVNQLLKDKDEAGYRLCTDFGEFDERYGRVSGFVYGYKEHGSKWMQQNIMFAYGLYHRGFTKEAYQVFKDIFALMDNSGETKIFPGIPSFIDKEGRGAYNYLTGSSSWFMMMVVTQMFGVRGEKGNLRIQPKLIKKQFDNNGEASIQLWFRNKELIIRFKLENNSNPKEIFINNKSITVQYELERGWLIDKQIFDALTKENLNSISIKLSNH